MGQAGRPKGTPKTGGRKPGTPNKVKNELREKIKAFAEENFEEVIAAWNCITEPKDKVKAYIDLCTYALPKLQAVQLDAHVSNVSSVEDDLRELAEETDF